MRSYLPRSRERERKRGRGAKRSARRLYSGVRKGVSRIIQRWNLLRALNRTCEMTNALQDASRLSDRLPWRDSCVFGAAEIIYKTRDEIIIFREWGFLQYRRGWISLDFIRKMRRNIYIWKNIYFIRGKLIKEYNYIGNKIFSISTDIIFIYPPSHEGSNLRISSWF